MTVDIAIQTGTINLTPPPSAETGAVVRFEGHVRGDEHGQPISALVYEAYQPMAEKQMEKILREIGEHHSCLSVTVRHRIGEVPVGNVAILVEARSSHRAEAFALTSAFMDRLKQDVPIWKMRAVPAKS
jgi:molybdopterin synthase catalytic subunit